MACYFNPCGYESLRRNYLRFAEGMLKQHVPLYTIELAFDDAPFFLKPAANVVRLRTTHVLWHKERLLNLLLPHVPREFDKIAWIDADLTFLNPSWADYASRLLEQYAIVQLFDCGLSLNREGRPRRAHVAMARAVLEDMPRASSSAGRIRASPGPRDAISWPDTACSTPTWWAAATRQWSCRCTDGGTIRTCGGSTPNSGASGGLGQTVLR